MSDFGIVFDTRTPHDPATAEEAVVYVRRWAAFEGVDIPSDAEVRTVKHNADPTGGRIHATLHVFFEWDDATQGTSGG